jgi:hypothetical protein
VEETFDLAEGIAGGVGIGIDKKRINPKHLPARSRFGEGRRNPKFETISNDRHIRLETEFLLSVLSPLGRGEGEGCFENLVI